MGKVSTRIPEELEADLEAYIDEENLDRSTAVRQLLTEGLDAWRTRRALSQLQKGEVSFTRAAELAGVSVWNFAKLVRDDDIDWVSGDVVDADLDGV